MEQSKKIEYYKNLTDKEKDIPSLSYFSKNHPDLLNNESFLLFYFQSYFRDKKNYKYIPKKFLDNEFWLYSVVKYNPDILLLADPKMNTPYIRDVIRSAHGSTFLKYYPTESITQEIVDKAIQTSFTNFQFAPENFITSQHIHQVFDKFKLQFAQPKDIYSLYKKIPTQHLTDYLINRILVHSDYRLLRFLTDEKYTKDLNVCKKAILANCENYIYMPEEIKLNQSFIFDVLDAIKKEKINNRFIALLPEFLFNQSFCEQYKSLFDLTTYKMSSPELKNNTHYIVHTGLEILKDNQSFSPFESKEKIRTLKKIILDIKYGNHELSNFLKSLSIPNDKASDVNESLLRIYKKHLLQTQLGIQEETQIKSIIKI